MARKHSRRRIRGAGPTEDARLAQLRALAAQAKANVEKKWATVASPQELSKSVATYEKVVSLLLDAQHAKVTADGRDAINALKAQQGIAGRRRKTRRRTRKAKRGGFVPEGGKAFITHAPFPPPDNSFSTFAGTPDNTDNSFTLHPSGKKGGKRRSVKRK
jgi:hypothetical protein